MVQNPWVVACLLSLSVFGVGHVWAEDGSEDCNSHLIPKTLDELFENSKREMEQPAYSIGEDLGVLERIEHARLTEVYLDQENQKDAAILEEFKATQESSYQEQAYFPLFEKLTKTTYYKALYGSAPRREIYDRLITDFLKGLELQSQKSGRIVLKRKSLSFKSVQDILQENAKTIGLDKAAFEELIFLLETKPEIAKKLIKTHYNIFKLGTSGGTPEQIVYFKLPRPRTSDGFIQSLVLSSDGSQVVVAGLSGEGHHFILDTNTGKIIKKIHDVDSNVLFLYHLKAIVRSPDESYLVTSTVDKRLFRYDFRSSKWKELSSPSSEILSMVFMKDGKRILAMEEDSIRILDAQSGTNLNTVVKIRRSSVLGFRSMVLSPSERLVAAREMGKISVIYLSTQQVFAEIPLDIGGHSVAMAFSEDEQELVFIGDDGGVYWYDLDKRQITRSLKNSTERRATAGAIFKDQKAAIALEGGSIRVVDLRTGKHLYTLDGFSRDVQEVHFTQDGSKIVAAGDGHTIRIWEE